MVGPRETSPTPNLVMFPSITSFLLTTGTTIPFENCNTTFPCACAQHEMMKRLMEVRHNVKRWVWRISPKLTAWTTHTQTFPGI